MTAAREVVGWPVGPGVLADAESTAVGAASGELPVSALLSPRGRLARDPPTPGATLAGAGCAGRWS